MATQRQAGAAARTPEEGTARKPASAGAAKRTAGRGAPARGATTARTPATRAAPEGSRAHRSAVETLLAEHPGDQPAPRAPARPAAEVAGEVASAGAARVSGALRGAQRAAQAAVAGTVPGAEGRHAAPEEAPAPVRISPGTGLPPIQDVALGAAAVLAERLWAAGALGMGWANGLAARTIMFVRAVSPQVATAQADARLLALAERGQRVRRERAEALSEAVTSAISSAATSDAMRDMTVAAIDQATDDVLEVVLPAVLEAVTEMETQAKLDELMAGLLLRQLPSALERTLPGVMLRTATKPALGFVPSLMGALSAGLSGEAGTEEG